MWVVFKANSPASQTLFQSGWFVEGLLSLLVIIHMIRTRKIPFIESVASWPLIFFPFLIGILVAYAILTQAVKGFFARRFGWQ